jgi:methionyl-tRNA formyltransferase
MTKVVIVGYDKMFANLITGCISAGYEPVGVFRYDKVKYNPFLLKIKDIFYPSKEKSFINGYNLYEIDARSVNSEAFRRELIRLNVDIVFIGSWGEKFSKETINVPKIGTINCHPSLLPKYRGPNPYAQVILNGETKTGITFHLADENYDTGAILSQTEVEIRPKDTGGSLRTRCCKIAGQEVGKLLRQMDTEMIVPVNQQEKLASYQPQITEKDVLLNFEHTAESIDRRIRAFSPWSKCYIAHKNQYFTFEKYEIGEETCEEPCRLIEKGKNYICIVAGDKKIIKFSQIKIYKKNMLFTKLYTLFLLKIGDKMA